METVNTLRIGDDVSPCGPLAGFCAVLAALILPGCVTGPRANPTEGTVGPPMAAKNQSPYGPSEGGLRPATLVFGPGMAKGFAYAGVLRALEENKIPVSAIVGTEAGAWIAALYALSTGKNSFDFSLLKFRESVFFEKRLFGEPKPTEGKPFVEALESAFGNKDLSRGRVRAILVAQRVGDGHIVLMEKGPAARAVRAAMGVPALFTDVDWLGERVVAANGGMPYPVQEAKGIAEGPVIAVSVLTKDEAKGSADELAKADLVLWVDTSGIAYLDFDKRSEATYRGKNAVQSNLKELKALVGIKDSP